MVFETQRGTRNRTRDLQKKGSAFILSSDHWTELWLPRLVLCHSSSTLLLAWVVIHLGTRSCSVWLLSLRSCLVLRSRVVHRPWSGSVFAPSHLPAPTPVLHVSAPVHRGVVADARLVSA